MIKKKLTNVKDRLEDGLRSLLEQISPDGRIIVTIVLLLAFSAASIFMTVSSIYNMGKKSGRQQLQIEHIKRLELEQRQKQDSVKSLNKFNYE